MEAHMNYKKSMNPCSREEKSSSVHVPGPLQGLRVAIGGLEIVSCLVEKINKVREYASGNGVREGEKQKDSQNGTLLDNALNVFTDLKTRVTEFLLPPYNEKTTQKTDEDKKIVDDKFARLWRSHSQGCVTTCKYDHHAFYSSWRHAMKVHRSHVPVNIQEPFIEYGYLLPFMPWRYYLKGLYTPSYELMNVWTHLIPSIYFFYLLIVFSQEMDILLAWPLFLVTTAGTLLCFFSAMAHLFHSRSSLHHSCWFVADYFGITLYAFASLTTNFYSGASLDYFNFFSGQYLKICTTIVFAGYTCLCLTQTGQKWVSLKLSRQLKVYINGFGYAFGALPLYIRTYENWYTGKMEISLWFHIIAVPSMFLAPLIYGLDFPQCLFPGKFDVFGHSHMWFHILTAYAAYCETWGVYYDVKEGPWNILQQQEDYPSLLKIFMYYIVIVVYGYLLGKVIHTTVKNDHVHEEPLLQGKHLCACGLPETARIHHSTRKITRIQSESSIVHWEIAEADNESDDS